MPIFRILRILAGASLILSLSSCNNLLFFPQREYLLSPSELQLEFEEVRFPMADGVTLAAWHLHHKTEGPRKGTILFLHGNAENISTHIFSVDWLPAAGYDVYSLDYRGFGASEGGLSMNRSISDIRTVIESISSTAHGPLIVFGQSIGAALAIPAIAPKEIQHQLAAVILESPVSSYRRIAREKLGELWLTWPLQWPLSFLLSDHYAPERWAEKLMLPTLIVHSRDDEIVPFHHGERVYGLAKGNGRTEFIAFDGERHIHIFRRIAAREQLLDFLRRTTLLP